MSHRPLINNISLAKNRSLLKPFSEQSFTGLLFLGMYTSDEQNPINGIWLKTIDRLQYSGDVAG